MKNKEIKIRAKEFLLPQFSNLMAAEVIAYMLKTVALIVTLGVGRFFVSGPLINGTYSVFEKARKGEKVNGIKVFDGFKNRVGDSMLAGVIQGVILAVPSFFLIGIVLSFAVMGVSIYTVSSYQSSFGTKALTISVISILLIIVCDVLAVILSLTFDMAQYILVRNEDISAMEALKLSGQMMRGNKGRLLKLYISFVGWFALSIITASLASAWTLPYLRACRTVLFSEIYDNY